MDYEYLDEGKVVIVNNLRFEDGTLDHSWNRGRPCLILFEDEEYEYVCSIKSETKKEYRDKYYIDNKSFMYLNGKGYKENVLNDFIGRSKNCRIKTGMRQNLSGYVNLDRVIKIPIAYRNVVGKLKFDVYKDIKSKLHKIQKTKTNEELKVKAFNRR